MYQCQQLNNKEMHSLNINNGQVRAEEGHRGHLAGPPMIKAEHDNFLNIIMSKLQLQ